MFKTVKEWQETLPKSYCEALADLYHESDVLSANEALDALVEYLGGVTTGYGIRKMVADIYGINLQEVK